MDGAWIGLVIVFILVICGAVLYWLHRPSPPGPDPGPPGPPSPPDDTDIYYNPKYSGTNTAGVPMFNSYSKMVADAAYGVYGFSLDDAVGLKRCGSWTLNTIIGPRCNKGSDGKCKLPPLGITPPTKRSTYFSLNNVTDSAIDFADSQSWYSSEPNKGAYFVKDQVKQYLTVFEIVPIGGNRIDSVGYIDTDYVEFPQNNYFIETLGGDQSKVQKNSHMNFAFNVVNQSGGKDSLINVAMPFWASIEIGSPPFVAALIKVPPNKGYQFLFNFGADVLVSAKILQPDTPIRNKYLSNYLSSSNYTSDPDDAWCAGECNSQYSSTYQVQCDAVPWSSNPGQPGMGISAEDLNKVYPGICNNTASPMNPPPGKSRGIGPYTCDPYLLIDGVTPVPKYSSFDLGLSDGSRFADTTTTGQPATCQFGNGKTKCPTVNPTKKPSGGTMSCPTGSYTDANKNVVGQWDPSVTQCNLGDKMSFCNVKLNPMCSDTPGRVKPMCCDDVGYGDIKACQQKTMSDGKKYDSKHYAWQVGGGRISISYIDPDDIPGSVPESVANEMRLAPLCGDNCSAYPKTDDWRAQHYITGAKIASSIKDNYAALVEFTLDIYTNQSDPTNIIPVINYDISGVNNLSSLPLYTKAVGVNKSQGGCQDGDCCFTFVGNIGEDIIKNCPTDIYYTTNKSGQQMPFWGKCPSPIDYCIKPDTDVGKSGVVPSKHPLCNLWNGFENELKKPLESGVNVNTPIWGCDPNYINPEKCRSLHLGTFPNYTQLTDGQGTSSKTVFNPPKGYLDWGFSCTVPSCVNADGSVPVAGAKPYQGSGVSMDCGPGDTNCCGATGPIKSNYCWGNGSVRYSKS